MAFYIRSCTRDPEDKLSEYTYYLEDGHPQTTTVSPNIEPITTNLTNSQPNLRLSRFGYSTEAAAQAVIDSNPSWIDIGKQKGFIFSIEQDFTTSN